MGVNHLEGHLLAPFLKDESYQPPADFKYPYIALAVSGGHSSLYWVKGLGDYTIIGTTKDDAAGEAFDKFAKMAGLGYPGGLLVDQMAQGRDKSGNKIGDKSGDIKKYDFPRSLILEDNLMLSFSGLKSSAHRLLDKMSPEEIKSNIHDLCASYQEAIVDVLIHKLHQAALRYKSSRLVVTGGVSANSRLRARAAELAKKEGYTIVIPPLRYCTDNAAMIGYVGILRLNRGEKSDLGLKPLAQNEAEDFAYDLQ